VTTTSVQDALAAVVASLPEGGEVREGQQRMADAVAHALSSRRNLVVRAGIRRVPYPHLTYGCGMGKCGRCACRVIDGADHLPEPNWQETKRLGSRIEAGFRLMCQLWIRHDIELLQDDALNAAAPREG